MHEIRSTPSETIFEIPTLKDQIRNLESEIAQDSFWQENSQAQSIFENLSRLKKTVQNYDTIISQGETIETLISLLSEQEDPELLRELATETNGYVQKVADLEMTVCLSGPYDHHNCIVSIFAGAGGTDSQDWAQMLLRMYTRWFERKGFQFSLADCTYGEEAGIKSATLMVQGDLAYGYLKNEAGVHRLVRLSPFNANSKRQTSFAAVDVIPQITEAETDFKIDPKELRVDTFRASGAGGQHVNKTDSAVRITHLPTGLVAQSQSSRSQIENREVAMGILLSRIAKRRVEERTQAIDAIRGESKENAWGSQIRSYVLHPYTLVKDHRSDSQTSNAQAVLDGDIDQFILDHLRLKAAKK